MICVGALIAVDHMACSDQGQKLYFMPIFEVVRFEILHSLLVENKWQVEGDCEQGICSANDDPGFIM